MLRSARTAPGMILPRGSNKRLPIMAGYSWCTLITLSTNLGFTGGNNVLIRAALQSAPPQYVLLLNADTIVRPNGLRALVDYMDQHPAVGVAGSRLEDPDGTPQRSAFRFPSPLSEFESSVNLGLVTRLLDRWVVAPPVSEASCCTDWVAGASMIVRREVFRDIGLLDEGYFTFFEDVDFCFNAREGGMEDLLRSGKPHRALGGTIDRYHGQEAQAPAAIFVRGTPPLFLKELRATQSGIGRPRTNRRSRLVEDSRHARQAGLHGTLFSSRYRHAQCIYDGF